MTEENHRQNVVFESNGGECHGYLRKPPVGSGPGVLVIQEWWGLDDHMVDIVERLAAEGFVALAPDLYGGRVAHDAGTAGRFMAELPAEQAARDLTGAVEFLLADPSVTSDRLGAVGFCMGGGFVLQLASQQGERIGAAVAFYGVGQGLPDSFSTVSAAVQGHYGELDAFYPVESARNLEAKIRKESAGPVEFFYYPAAHAFHNDRDPLGKYDEGSARLAWGRTLNFLKQNLT